MQVLLIEDVDKLGEQGQIVTVKPGFGRNFLIPRGLARQATASVIRAFEEERRQQSRKLGKKKEDAQNLAKELASMEVVVFAKVGEESRIFGSITTNNIADGLAAQGVTVDRRKIEIEDDIKMLGVYTASVKLHPEVDATIKVRVEPEVATS